MLSLFFFQRVGSSSPIYSFSESVNLSETTNEGSVLPGWLEKIKIILTFHEDEIEKNWDHVNLFPLSQLSSLQI